MRKATSKRKKSVPYEPVLLEELKDMDFAINFLNSCIDNRTDDDFEIFFDALLKVLKAHGVAHTAEKAKISRDAMYKAFTKHRNPTVKTFWKILDAVGMQIAIVPRHVTA